MGRRNYEVGLWEFPVQSVFDCLGNCGAVNGDTCSLESLWVCNTRAVRICVVPKGSVVNNSSRMRREAQGIRVVPNGEVSPPHCSCCPLVVMCEPSREENLDHSHIPGRDQPQQMRKAISVNANKDLAARSASSRNGYANADVP